MRSIIVGITLLVSPIVVGISYSATHIPEIELTRKCEEDMPCWNCSEMGNKICGPTFTETLTEVMPGPFEGWN
jgi:hypothetical protein